MDKKFIIYWRDGTTTLIEGFTVDQAFTKAGYGGGAINAVDFHMDYDPRVGQTYEWDKEKKNWVKKSNKTN